MRCAPALGLIAGIKPMLAFAGLVYQSTRRSVALAIATGAVLLTVSIVIDPRWPFEWIEMLRTRRRPEPTRSFANGVGAALSGCAPLAKT